MVRLRRPWFSCCLAFLLAPAAPTRAFDATPFGLDYAAETACPARESFVREVRGRTALAAFVPAAHVTQPFVVNVWSEGAQFRGSVARAGRESRSVAGETCQDVVSALALIVALAVDPEASLAPVEPPAASAPVSAPPIAPDVAPRDAPTASAQSPSARALEPVRRMQLSAFVRGDFAHALTRSAAAFFGATLGLEAGARRASWWQPLGRAALRVAKSERDGDAGARLAFHLVTARVEIQAFTFQRGRVGLAPYLAFEAGRLVGTVEGVLADGTARARRPWLVPAQGLQLAVQARAWLYLALLAELREPIKRYRLSIAGESGALLVARVSRLELAACFALGVRFW